MSQVEDVNARTRAELTIITESLSTLERYQLEEQARQASQLATDANNAALDALDRVADISARLPDDLDAANQLARDMEEARKSIQRASEQGESPGRLLGCLKPPGPHQVTPFRNV